MRRLWSGLLSASLLAACADTGRDAARGACLGRKLTELPLTPVAGYVVAPVAFGGRVASMIVDTGSTVSALYGSALAGAGLVETGPAFAIQGATGIARGGYADVPLLRFAGFDLVNLTLPVIERAAPPSDGPPVAGLLGAPFLAAFDVELDAPARRLSLYARATCAGLAPPWRSPFFELNATALPNNPKLRPRELTVGSGRAPAGQSFANDARLLVDVELNGRPMRALLDTGSRTIVTPEAAELALLPPERPRRPETVSGIDGGLMQGELRHADELRLGGLSLRDVPVGVFPILNAASGMVLGLGALAHERVWISFAEKRVFVQRSDSASGQSGERPVGVPTSDRPSPRPSPRGRGRRNRRPCCSLSLGERAGVRVVPAAISRKASHPIALDPAPGSLDESSPVRDVFRP